MTIDEAISFVSSNHHGVLMTVRADGKAQQSPVAIGVDEQGQFVVSTTAKSAKVANIRNNPYVSLCVFTDAFFGPWVQVEGQCEIVAIPEALDGLVAYYRSVAGEHDDWEQYRSAMIRDQRVLLRIHPERVGPTKR